MSELSCDTLFIGRNETHDLSRYHYTHLDTASHTPTLSPYLTSDQVNIYLYISDNNNSG